MTTETAAKRNTQKLQRAIVDGLEDVKAQDILVFDTEHLSSLFERVIVASGTSNRQTRALAASVRDAVREAGFPKPRIEGESNGEWIIVDCSQAVVHIMQPTFRSYYHLEELWGEKPVRLKFGASKPVPEVAVAKKLPSIKTSAKTSAKTTTKTTTRTATRTAAKTATKTVAKKTATGKAGTRATTAPMSPATRDPRTPATRDPTTSATRAAKTAVPRVKTLVVSKPTRKTPPPAKRGTVPGKSRVPRKTIARKA